MSGTEMRDTKYDQSWIELCSSCRGNYEDPDVSVMHDDSSTSEGDDSGDESDEEFPARRERRGGSRDGEGGPKGRSKEDRSMRRTRKSRKVRTSARQPMASMVLTSGM